MSKFHHGLEMEEQGAQWLAQKFPSLYLLQKNYRWRGGELDLVFEDRTPGRSRELIFVEVRTRQRGALVDGVASITYPKQRRLAQTISHFLSRYEGCAFNVRFDVLAHNGEEWIHLPNIRLL